MSYTSPKYTYVSQQPAFDKLQKDIVGGPDDKGHKTCHPGWLSWLPNRIGTTFNGSKSSSASSGGAATAASCHAASTSSILVNERF